MKKSIAVFIFDRFLILQTSNLFRIYYYYPFKNHFLSKLFSRILDANRMKKGTCSKRPKNEYVLQDRAFSLPSTNGTFHGMLITINQDFILSIDFLIVFRC